MLYGMDANFVICVAHYQVHRHKRTHENRGLQKFLKGKPIIEGLSQDRLITLQGDDSHHLHDPWINSLTGALSSIREWKGECGRWEPFGKRE